MRSYKPGLFCAVSVGALAAFGVPQADAAIAVVQGAMTNHTGLTATMGATPTSGNLLVAVCWGGTLPSANTGWTSENSGTISAFTYRVVLKIVSGETTSVTPCTGGTGTLDVSVTELSGAGSVIASIYQASNGTSTYRGTPTISITTTKNNTMGVGSANNNGNGAGHPTSCSGTTSTQDVLTANTLLCHGLVASSGTSATFTATPPGGSGAWTTYVVEVLVNAVPITNTGQLTVLGAGD